MSSIDSILSFLNDLAAHNTKEWMDEHKATYQEARHTFIHLVDQVIDGLAKMDPAIEGIRAKDCIFRINRDIRFSANKNPYKTNFGASISQGGRHAGNPVYYIHLEPGRSFTAGGVYMPEPANLAKVRQEIDYHPEEFIGILGSKAFKEKFPVLEGEVLKTAPKGYAKDHPHIDLLKHKSYIVSRKISDKELRDSRLVSTILEDFKALLPFNHFLSRALS